MTHVVVVGDVILDRDVLGRVDRICADAPVPVVDELEAIDRPGGAGLAALLLRERGVEVTLVCALTGDEAANRLVELLDAVGVTVVDCGDDGSTIEKIRIRVDNRSLLRLDRGCGGTVGSPPAEAARRLEAADAVLVADYGRGVAAQPEIRALIESVVDLRIPVVWDPHPRGPAPVGGCTIVCPNRHEADGFVTTFATAAHGGSARLAQVVDQARELRRHWSATTVAVTLGAEGALLVSGDGAPLVVPVDHRVDAGDPCGAGDAFAAAAATALARGGLPSTAISHAVAMAARFVAAGGAGVIGHPTSAQRWPGRRTHYPTGPVLDRSGDVRGPGGIVVATGGCFDIIHPGHVATLERARQLGDHLVVLVNSDRSVRRLKGSDRPSQPERDRAAVLASLACVDDVVIFDEDTPVEALRVLRPDIFVKGGDYSASDLPEASVMSEWGGTVVTVPFVDGRSTTQILQRAQRGPSRVR